MVVSALVDVVRRLGNEILLWLAIFQIIVFVFNHLKNKKKETASAAVTTTVATEHHPSNVVDINNDVGVLPQQGTTQGSFNSGTGAPALEGETVVESPTGEQDVQGLGDKNIHGLLAPAQVDPTENGLNASDDPTTSHDAAEGGKVAAASTTSVSSSSTSEQTAGGVSQQSASGKEVADDRMGQRLRRRMKKGYGSTGVILKKGVPSTILEVEDEEGMEVEHPIEEEEVAEDAPRHHEGEDHTAVDGAAVVSEQGGHASVKKVAGSGCPSTVEVTVGTTPDPALPGAVLSTERALMDKNISPNNEPTTTSVEQDQAVADATGDAGNGGARDHTSSNLPACCLNNKEKENGRKKKKKKLQLKAMLQKQADELARLAPDQDYTGQTSSDGGGSLSSNKALTEGTPLGINGATTLASDKIVTVAAEENKTHTSTSEPGTQGVVLAATTNASAAGHVGPGVIKSEQSPLDEELDDLPHLVESPLVEHAVQEDQGVTKKPCAIGTDNSSLTADGGSSTSLTASGNGNVGSDTHLADGSCSTKIYGAVNSSSTTAGGSTKSVDENIKRAGACSTSSTSKEMLDLEDATARPGGGTTNTGSPSTAAQDADEEVELSENEASIEELMTLEKSPAEVLHANTPKFVRDREEEEQKRCQEQRGPSGGDQSSLVGADDTTTSKSVVAPRSSAVVADPHSAGVVHSTAAISQQDLADISQIHCSPAHQMLSPVAHYNMAAAYYGSPTPGPTAGVPGGDATAGGLWSPEHQYADFSQWYYPPSPYHALPPSTPLYAPAPVQNAGWDQWIMPTAQHYSQAKSESSLETNKHPEKHHYRHQASPLESDASTRSGVTTSDSQHCTSSTLGAHDQQSPPNVNHLEITPPHSGSPVRGTCKARRSSQHWPSTPTPRAAAKYVEEDAFGSGTTAEETLGYSKSSAPSMSSETYVEVHDLVESQHCEEALQRIKNLAPEEKTENRQAMAGWMYLFVRGCRKMGTAMNGEIVSSLYDWLQLRNILMPAADVNVVFFMLGRNREYELLVLLFQRLVTAALSEPRPDRTEPSFPCIPDPDEHQGPSADATASLNLEEGLKEAEVARDIVGSEEDGAKKGAQGQACKNPAADAAAAHRSVDVKGCGCAIQAATELASVDILKEVCGLIDSLVEDANARHIDPPVNERLYYAILGHWAKLGELGLAEEALHRARATNCVNSRFYHLLLSSFASEKKWGKVDEIIQLSKGSLTSRQTFNLRVRMASEQQDLGGMRELMTESKREDRPMDEYAYYHLLKGFISKREVSPAEELFREMELEAAKPLEKTKLQCGIGCPVYVLMFDLYFKTKNTDKALELFDKVRVRGKATHAIYAQMVRNLTYAARWPDAIAILKDMNDNGLADLEIHGLLVNKLFEAGRRFEASQLLMDKRPLESKHTKEKLPLAASSTILIRSAGHLQCLHFAFGVFFLYREAKSCDSFMMNSLIDACIVNFRPRKAISLYTQMRDDGLEPDCVTYNTVIRAYAMERDSDSAFNILDEMRRNAVQPNVVTYNTLVHTCVQLNQFARAWQLVSEMQSLNVHPDCATYTSLISAIKQMKDYGPSVFGTNPGTAGTNNASSVVQHQNQQVWNANTNQWEQYNTPASSSSGGASSNWGQSSQWQSSSSAGASGWYANNGGGGGKGQHNNKWNNHNSYAGAGGGYGQHNRSYNNGGHFSVKQEVLERAFNDVWKLQQNGSRIDGVLVRALLDACAHCGRPDLAEQIFELSRDLLKFSQFEYGLLIKCYSQQRDLESAFRVKQRIELDNLPLNAVLFGALIDLCLKMSEDRKAEELFEEMEAMNIPHSIISMSLKIKMYGRLNKPEKAMQALYQIQELNLPPGILTFNSVIDSVARTGGHHHFQEILQMIKAYELSPNGCTYSIIAKGYAQGGALDKALETFQMMEQNGFAADPVTYNSLLDGCAKEGKVEIAERLLAEMTEKRVYPNAITWSILVKLYVPIDIHKAYGVLEQLKQNQGKGGRHGYHGKYHHQHSTYDEYGDYYTKNCAKTSSQNDKDPLRVVYSAFVHALANHGDLVRGKSVLQQMDQEGFRPEGYHYSALAVAAAHQNKLTMALEFVELAAAKKHFRACLLSAKTYQTLLKAIDRKRDSRARERLQHFSAEGVFQGMGGSTQATAGPQHHATAQQAGQHHLGSSCTAPSKSSVAQQNQHQQVNYLQNSGVTGAGLCALNGATGAGVCGPHAGTMSAGGGSYANTSTSAAYAPADMHGNCGTTGTSAVLGSQAEHAYHQYTGATAARAITSSAGNTTGTGNTLMPGAGAPPAFVAVDQMPSSTLQAHHQQQSHHLVQQPQHHAYDHTNTSQLSSFSAPPAASTSFLMESLNHKTSPVSPCYH
ncbi:unnamed protein product [Amoebophrya sp. A120]|nr:unnamed protein product [Amoebophrya sp. A120]|eukprot:GSA120T00017935001.1